jgi:hypothetical protein
MAQAIGKVIRFSEAKIIVIAMAAVEDWSTKDKTTPMRIKKIIKKVLAKENFNWIL